MQINDFWTDESTGEFEDTNTVKNQAPRTARLVVTTKK